MKKLNSPINQSRRKFFGCFFAEIISAIEQVRGKPQMRLENMESLPDKVMAGITPVLKQSTSYRIVKDCLLIKNKENGSFKEVYRFNATEYYMLGFFDGYHTLKNIGVHLENRFGINPEESFEYVKSFFINMASYAVCHPADAHDNFPNETL